MQRRSLSLALNLQPPLIVHPGDLIPWRAVSLHDTLTPAELESYGATLHTFDMPGAKSAPAQHIKLHEDGLSFSMAGFYFFSLPCACVKVLVKQPAAEEVDRCIEIAAFVSACSVHSLADYHRIARGPAYNVESSLEKQFVSNLPHAFHCGEVTVFLIYLLATQGYAAKWLWMHRARQGHIVCSVDSGDKGVILDADFGVAIPWTPRQLLKDKVNRFANVPFIPLGEKRFLSSGHQLNLKSRSVWGWVPAFSAGTITFSPEAYTNMLVEFCDEIEIREPICDSEGGFEFDFDRITIAPENADPRRSFEDSAALALERCSAEKRQYLEVVLAKVDAKRVEEIRDKYWTEIHVRFPQEQASELKYLDLPYWLSHKLDLAMRLGLHASSPKSILDLGTGGAHFLAVCQSFGHSALGIDIELPLYADIAQCLGVRRLIERVEPQKRLLDRGERFDLVTAIWISFNSLSSTDGTRRYWSLEDWCFLLEDLKDNVVKVPGRIHFELNQEIDDETNVGRFNPEVVALFARMDADVDGERGLMTLDYPDRQRASEWFKTGGTPMQPNLESGPPKHDVRATVWAKTFELGTRLHDRWLGRRFR